MNKRLLSKIPAGGPLVPSSEEIAKTAVGLRQAWKRGFVRGFMDGGGLRKDALASAAVVAVRDGWEIEAQAKARTIHAETIATFAVAIQKTMDSPEGVSVVDGAFLTLTRPGYQEDQMRLCGQLNDAIGLEPDDDSSPAAKLERFSAALGRRESAVLGFVNDWAGTARRHRLNPWMMLVGILSPLAFVCWYSSGERRREGARGPDREVVSRVRVWGHYLVSLILGEQKAALRFWYDCCKEHPDVADLTYSTPTQDPCSQRAQSAYSMAKKRLFDDLQNVGIIPAIEEIKVPHLAHTERVSLEPAPPHCLAPAARKQDSPPSRRTPPRPCPRCGGSLIFFGDGEAPRCLLCAR